MADQGTATNSNSRSETEVGIKCFLGTAAPFTGILKQRYTDFVVNEIDRNGKVVRLELFTPPKVEETSEAKVEEVADPMTRLVALVGEEEAKLFGEFHNGASTTDHKAVFKFKEDTDKDHRTAVHKLMREAFQASSETEGGCVVVSARCNRGKVARVAARGWPSDKPKYVEFTLYKENKESMHALGILAKIMNGAPSMFSLAGTKDKRGVTAQRCTVFKKSPEQIGDLNKRLHEGISVGGPFTYVADQLRLGDLSGNRFTVVLRDISANDSHVDEAAKQFAETGFINYYGLQRFGTGSVATHVVGMAVLRGDWERAVQLILHAREGERDDLVAARKKFETNGDIEALLRVLPRFMTAERHVLNGLKRDPKAFQNAFGNLPRTLRMLYPHAYQSFLWNRMASARIERYGFAAPVAGDIVVLEETTKATATTTEEDSSEILEAVEDEANDDDKAEFKVAIVSEDDVANKRYTMSQVVLPMAGTDIQYPTNEIGALYHSTMKEDGIVAADFTSRTKIYHIKGTYRKLLSRASDVEYKVLRYNSLTISLVHTDYDRLKGKPEPQDVPDGQYRALRISFSLPSSSYATMAYRELLKQSTEVISQISFDEKPEKEAIVVPAGSLNADGSLDYCSVTYRQLLSDSVAFARLLRSKGIEKGQVVSIVLGNGYPILSTFLGATFARCIAAPLNSTYKLEEFKFYLEDMGASLVIIQSGLNDAKEAAKELGITTWELTEVMDFASHAIGYTLTSKDGVLECSVGEDEMSNVLLDEVPENDDIAMFLHTSGTTSRPKGVPLAHKNIYTTTGNIRDTFNLGSADRSLVVMPLFHVHGLIGVSLSTLYSGGSLVVPPRFSATTFWQAITQFKATWYSAVPTIHAILYSLEKDGVSPHKGLLRFIRSCSSSLSPTLFDSLEKCYGCPILESYGMTEAAHQMTSNLLPEDGKRKPGSVGKGTGVDVGIANPEGELLGVGEVGEVCCRGENIWAAVIPKPHAASTLTVDVITQFLQKKIVAFKIPKKIFIAPSFPKTSTGKIQRRFIAEHFLNIDKASK
eukprot:gene14169-16701_t